MAQRKFCCFKCCCGCLCDKITITLPQVTFDITDCHGDPQTVTVGGQTFCLSYHHYDGGCYFRNANLCDEPIPVEPGHEPETYANATCPDGAICLGSIGGTPVWEPPIGPAAPYSTCYRYVGGSACEGYFLSCTNNITVTSGPPSRHFGACFTWDIVYAAPGSSGILVPAASLFCCPRLNVCYPHVNYSGPQDGEDVICCRFDANAMSGTLVADTCPTFVCTEGEGLECDCPPPLPAEYCQDLYEADRQNMMAMARPSLFGRIVGAISRTVRKTLGLSQRGPSIPRMALNFTRAASSHVLTGRQIVSDEERDRRVSLCVVCDLYDKKTGRCTHPSCGCKCGVKASWKMQRCPIGKW